MAYAYDPELASWISTLPEQDLRDYQATRDRAARLTALMPPYEPPVPVEARDVIVPGPDGAPEVPVRVYTPPETESPRPGVLYLHGGGFVAGSIAMFDGDATRLAAEADAVVVSVEYRLAPEHPFPAGVEDCYAVLDWVESSASELGIDPNRLAVCGESAGGGLAAAVTLLARDRGGPALRFQCLGIPELDDRLNTPSMRAYDDTPSWNRSAAEYSWDYYLGAGKRGTDDVSPYAAPTRGEDLSGLPPAFVSVCQFDPLRDEGIAYAQRLAQANVPTELVLYPGTFHGTSRVTEAGVTRRMAGDTVAALRRGLH